jgi:SepF-like predicted cell division protein (DUF552 family)
MEDNYAVVLDYGTGEVVMLDIRNLDTKNMNSDDLLERAEDQDLISSSSNCYIMTSVSLAIRREELK